MDEPAYQREILAEQGLYIVRFASRLTYRSAAAGLQDFFQMGTAVTDFRYFLIDCSAVHALALSLLQVNRLAGETNQLGQVLTQQHYTAFITTDPMLRGMARMWKHQIRYRSAAIELFADQAAGMAWLQQQGLSIPQQGLR